MNSNSVISEEKPLISFVLFAYNQDRYVHEAIDGALSQTYTPLEIILSDDRSSDETFQIMQNKAAEYSGPHKIVLNQNEKNLGICGHINRAMEISHGELIVVAAGDDISLPHRTATIYQAWVNSDKSAFSIDSRYVLIDTDGCTIKVSLMRNLPQEKQLEHFSKTMINYVNGCTHAWHRKVFEFFGPLPAITCEDVLIPLRSMLLGKVASIDEVLVKYRTHENNIWESKREKSTADYVDKIVYFINDFIKIADNAVTSIRYYNGNIGIPVNSDELDDCISNIHKCRKQLELKLNILTGHRVNRFISLMQYLMIYRSRQRQVGFFIPQHEAGIVIWSLSKSMYNILHNIKHLILNYKS